MARLLRDAERRATELLKQHREHLDRLVDLLVEKETVDGSVVYALVGVAKAADIGGGMAVAPHRGPPRAAASGAGPGAAGGAGPIA